MSKLLDLLEKKRKLKAQIAEAEAREKKAQRKRDTRLKVIVGAGVLADAAKSENSKVILRQMIDRAIVAPKDRQFLFEAGWID